MQQVCFEASELKLVSKDQLLLIQPFMFALKEPRGGGGTAAAGRGFSIPVALLVPQLEGSPSSAHLQLWRPSETLSVKTHPSEIKSKSARFPSLLGMRLHVDPPTISLLPSHGSLGSGRSTRCKVRGQDLRGSRWFCIRSLDGVSPSVEPMRRLIHQSLLLLLSLRKVSHVIVSL